MLKTILKNTLFCLGLILVALLPVLLLAVSKLIVFLVALALTFEVGDELLQTSASPTGAYVLGVHRMNPGATEPYYIHVRRTDDGRNELIYNVRGEDDAEVVWLSDEVVRINTVTLNIPAGDTYKGDTHYPEDFRVRIRIEAEDVCELNAEHFIDREFRGVYGVIDAGDPTRPFIPGERLEFPFEHRTDIPLEDSLEKGPFSFILTVHSTAGTLVRLPWLFEWQTGWGQVHDFTLTGSAKAGYTLSPGWDGCAVVPLEEAFPEE